MAARALLAERDAQIAALIAENAELQRRLDEALVSAEDVVHVMHLFADD